MGSVDPQFRDRSAPKWRLPRAVLFLLVALLLQSSVWRAEGQAYQAWVGRYDNDVSSDDQANKVATDSAGNVIVAGYTDEGISGKDLLVIKYSASGLGLWTNRYNGSANGNDVANALVVDGSDSILVTGYSGRTGSSSDFVTIKYSSAGVPLWTNWYNGPLNASDEALALAVASNGNVVVTGASYTSNGLVAHFATVSYSAGGAALWTNRYSGSANGTDMPQGVAIDASGNAYVAGYSEGGVTDYDFLTIKYSSAGVPLWTNRYDGGGSDQADSVAIDPNGNILVAGRSTGSSSGFDLTTIKYSSAGIPLWTNRLSSPGSGGDGANAVITDGNGNVFITGYYWTSMSNGYDFATVAYSGAGVGMWTNFYNGPASYFDQANAIAVDASGNAYVTGYSFGTNSMRDYATIAYSVAGIPLWTNRFNGIGNGDDVPQSIAMGRNGDVFVTGYSLGTNGTDSYDAVTVRYSVGGAALWTNRFNGHGNGSDAGKAVATDASNNVYVTGTSAGPNKYDQFNVATVAYSSAGQAVWTNTYSGPGNYEDHPAAIAVGQNGNIYVVGMATIDDGSNPDYLTIAYSSTGTPLWTNYYDGPWHGSDGATALAIDGNGNVFVTGASAGTNSYANFATIAYTSGGLPLWTNRYGEPWNGSSTPLAMALDTAGNVYVTGASAASNAFMDYLTLKYSNNGVPLWTNRYNGTGNGDDYANSIALDASGNVYVAGYSKGPVSYDYLTIAYSSTGIPLWTNRYDSPWGGDDEAQSIAVDKGGNVFVTGYSASTPFSSSPYDYLTIKYSSAGALLWTNRYGPGVGDNTGKAAAIDALGNVIVTGYAGTNGHHDYLTIAYSSSGVPLSTNRYSGRGIGDNSPFTSQCLKIGGDGGVLVVGASENDFAVVKYIYRPTVTIQPPNQTNAIGTTAALSVSAIGAAQLKFQWFKNGVDVPNATNSSYSIPSAQTNDSGMYSIVITNNFGSVTSQVATLTVTAPMAANVVSGPLLDSGQIVVRYYGTPGATYTIERTDSLAPSNWQKVANFAAPTTDGGFGEGVFEMRDTTNSATNRFYRAVYPSY